MFDRWIDQINYCNQCIFCAGSEDNIITCTKLVDNICKEEEYCNDRITWREFLETEEE